LKFSKQAENKMRFQPQTYIAILDIEIQFFVAEQAASANALANVCLR
jgi:hypothetical protein